MEEKEVYFAKTKEKGKIPTKRNEDGGYDIYACFDEQNIEIKRNEIKMIPTGIASAFDSKWRFLLHERGSTGIVGLKINAGLIDSGFRNEWMVLLNNTSKYDIIIDKNIDKQVVESYGFFKRLITGSKGILKYPYSKAVCQAKLEEVPVIEIKEIEYENLLKIESQRGIGMLGSSGK